MVDLSILALLLVIALVFLPVILNPNSNPPPIPSFAAHRNLISEDLTNLQRNKLNILEIGTGWGGMLSSLLTVETVRSITSIELSPFLYCYNKLAFYREPRAKLLLGNISNHKYQDLISSSDVIVLYMSRTILELVLSKAKPGAIIYSVEFGIKDKSLYGSNTCIRLSSDIYSVFRFEKR